MVKRKSRLLLNRPRSIAAKIKSKNKHIVENIPECTSDSLHKKQFSDFPTKDNGDPFLVASI